MSDQLILPLEQPLIVNSLLVDLIEEKEHLEVLERAYQISKNAVNDKILNLGIKLRQSCIHLSTSEKEEFDYHRREDWTITTCNTCGQQLSRT